MNKGYLFILTTAFLFGTMETALKFFGSLFHPIQITVLRFFIGGFMLLPLARAALKTHGAVLTKKDYLFFAKAGFIGVFVSMIFYQLAVVYGKAAVSGVLFSCNPIVVAVWAHFLLHETIDRYVISSLVLSAVGILSIVHPFHFQRHPHHARRCHLWPLQRNGAAGLPATGRSDGNELFLYLWRGRTACPCPFGTYCAYRPSIDFCRSFRLC